MNDKQPRERACLMCPTVFITDKPTRKFCSNNCRSAYDRLKQKQKAKNLTKQVEWQDTQLAREKERMILPVKASNAHWLAAELRCEAQRARCQRIEQDLEENREATRELTRPGEHYRWGWVIGIFLALIVISIGYNCYRRRNRGVDTTFGLVSVGGAVLIGWVGAQQGKKVDVTQRTPAQEEALGEALGELQQEKDRLTNALKEAKARLNELSEARDQLNPFAEDLPPTTSEDKDPLTPTDPA